MVGRFGGAQVLKRGWMREAFLLSTALCGSVLCGIIVAIFSGQVLVAYAASVLVGCCQGPLEPSIMALPALCCAFAVLPMQFSNRMQPSGANELP